MTLRAVLETLQRIVEDETVGGLAVNISELRASPAMIWEVRRALQHVRSSGKRVVVFTENLDEWSYHLASVADQLVLDPQGIVFLKGFALGRTYLQGTLEAVGIGVEEWRYFTYKSAFEAFSRDRMSDGEREQLQRMADGFYEVLRADVTEGRGVTPATFDRWMEEGVLLRAPHAVEERMVDRLGRWDEVDAVIADIGYGKKRLVSPQALVGTAHTQDDRWGEPPTIAVVYALGICAMDEGIAARSLVKDLRRVEEDPSVRAVVLRVDSPGGDALASDVIAEAMRRIGRKKPMIVSQGQVAASGGYWLSMYGDQVLASPVTITGSIGVIGGWFYNKGLKEKLGMTTDMVQAGRHADIGFGFRLPLVGVGLPDRALTTDEQAKVEGVIRSSYAEFVDKVGQGRGLSADSVAVLGEGRVWLGGDAKDRGLVDGLGGLLDAIALAKQKAGVASEETVHVLELPRTQWFELPGLLSMLAARQPPASTRDCGLDYLKFRLRHNGRVMPVLGVSEMDATVDQVFSFE
jgi:protease-4